MADQYAGGDEPKIQIDTDWKAQAQKEKERLAKQEQDRAAKSGAGKSPAGAGTASDPHAMPEASFRTLVGMLASQAIMGLGAVGDPQTGRVVVDLEASRFSIDLLEVLEEKTKNNLTADESSELRQVLAELRNRYVQIAQMVARQMAQQPPINPAAANDPAASKL